MSENTDDDNPFGQKKKRAFKRPRENYATCPVEKCKNEKGEWTKWVIERLDETQLKAYNDYMKLVKEQPHLSQITVNNHLRFLNGNKWDINKAFSFMMNAEKYRKDNKLDETTQEFIKPLVDMNYVKTWGHDRLGRPILWLKIKNYKPEASTREQGMGFMAYLIDYMGTLMTPNID